MTYIVDLFCSAIRGARGLKSPCAAVSCISTNCQMHLHGHDFFVLAEGKGIFSEKDLKTANLINPTRRDVVTMPASDPVTGNDVGGFIVIAFRLNNPGTWVSFSPYLAYLDSPFHHHSGACFSLQ
jgi:hypothetical protein